MRPRTKTRFARSNSTEKPNTTKLNTLLDSPEEHQTLIAMTRAGISGLNGARPNVQPYMSGGVSKELRTSKLVVAAAASGMQRPFHSSPAAPLPALHFCNEAIPDMQGWANGALRPTNEALVRFEPSPIATVLSEEVDGRGEAACSRQ